MKKLIVFLTLLFISSAVFAISPAEQATINAQVTYLKKAALVESDTPQVAAMVQASNILGIDTTGADARYAQLNKVGNNIFSQLTSNVFNSQTFMYRDLQMYDSGAYKGDIYFGNSAGVKANIGYNGTSYGATDKFYINMIGPAGPQYYTYTFDTYGQAVADTFYAIKSLTAPHAILTSTVKMKSTGSPSELRFLGYGLPNENYSSVRMFANNWGGDPNFTISNETYAVLNVRRSGNIQIGKTLEVDTITTATATDSITFSKNIVAPNIKGYEGIFVIADWTLVGSDYELTINHNFNTGMVIWDIFEYDGFYKKVIVPSRIHDANNIKIISNVAFDGRVNIISVK